MVASDAVMMSVIVMMAVPMIVRVVVMIMFMFVVMMIMIVILIVAMIVRVVVMIMIAASMIVIVRAVGHIPSLIPQHMNTCSYIIMLQKETFVNRLPDDSPIYLDAKRAPNTASQRNSRPLPENRNIC
jgi:hypothetical protein